MVIFVLPEIFETGACIIFFWFQDEELTGATATDPREVLRFYRNYYEKNIKDGQYTKKPWVLDFQHNSDEMTNNIKLPFMLIISGLVILLFEERRWLRFVRLRQCCMTCCRLLCLLQKLTMRFWVIKCVTFLWVQNNVCLKIQ